MITEVDGVKIKITANVDGFKKELKTTKEQLKKFGNTVEKEVGEKTTKSSKKGKTAMRRAFSVTALSPLLNSVSEFGLKATAIFTAVATSIGYAGKELGEALDNFANLGLTADEMEKFKGIAIGMSSELAFSVEEISKAMSDIYKTFGFTGDKLEEVTALFLKFSKVSGVDAAQGMEALKKIMNGMNIEFDEATKYLEMTNKLSQKIANFDGGAFLDFLGENAVIMEGLTKEQIPELISLYATLTKNGIDTANIQNLINAAYEDSIATGENVSDVWKRYFDVLNSGNTESADFIKISKLLGISMSELKGIVNAMDGDFNSFKDLLNSTGNSIDSAYESLNPLNKQWEIFKNNTSSLLGILGQSLLPILQVVNAVLSRLIGIFFDADGNMTALGRTITIVTGLFLAMSVIPSVLGLISRAIKGLAISIKAATGLTKGLKLMLAGLGALGVLGMLVGFVGNLFGGGSSGGGGSNVSSRMNTPSLRSLTPNSSQMRQKQDNSVTLNNQIISQTNLDGRMIAKNVTNRQRSFSLATSQNLGEH